MENYRPHRPTFFTTLVVVVVLFAAYHFTIGKRR